MTSGTAVALDLNRRSEEVNNFEKAIRTRVVGQDVAVETVTQVYQTFITGLNAPRRPVANLLFLGPTGSGKTRLVEALGETLFNDARSVIKIDCGEYQYGHEIAKLIGSPPGYLGHRETHPFLTQERLDAWHNTKTKLTLLLFDEIEKSSDSLWKLLLGIMDKAILSLGDNRTVDFSKTIVFLTSNLGSSEMETVVNGGLGYQPIQQVKDNKLSTIATNAAKKKFTPEFINRLDKMVVFKTLTEIDIEKILEIELGAVQKRILDTQNNKQFVFTVTPLAKKNILKEGMSTIYGARHLKRTIESTVVSAFSNLIDSNQINLGDLIKVDYQKGKMIFTREAENALFPRMLETWGTNA